MQGFKATIESKSDLTPRVKNIRLALEKPLAFQPGQYIFVELMAEGKRLLRAYSIANSPKEARTIDLCVTKVDGGKGSTFLHSIPVGTVLACMGPHGKFVLKESKNDLIFFAAGSGVAPFRSMIRYALENGWTQDINLVFGVRTEEDIIYNDDWQALAKKHQNFHPLITFSRMPADWKGEKGYVQTKAERFVKIKGKCDIYICGLGKMVEETQAELKRHGFPEEHIFIEKYD